MPGLQKYQSGLAHGLIIYFRYKRSLKHSAITLFQILFQRMSFMDTDVIFGEPVPSLSPSGM